MVRYLVLSSLATKGATIMNMLKVLKIIEMVFKIIFTFGLLVISLVLKGLAILMKSR